MDKLTAGYVSLGTEFYVPDRLIAISADAERQIAAAGIELVRTDPVFALGQEERAIRELKAQPWDFLIVNVINWIDPRAATRLLYEFRHEPIVLYSKGGFTEGDTLISPAAGAGSTALRFPMERWGIKFKYLFNGPDQPMDVEGIVKFGRAAQTMKKLRSARVGILGFNDMGLYTTGFNVTSLRGVTGVEVESFDMLQLERQMAAISDEAVEAEVTRVTADWQYPLGKPKEAAVERAIRMYLATVEICKQKNFSAVSYKCVEGIPAFMNAVHSVPSALVATAGYPYVDEDDVGNLVAELMLKWLSGGQPVTFLEHYEHHPDWILLGVDGFAPMQLLAGKPQVKPIQTVLLDGLVFCGPSENRAHDPGLPIRGQYGLPHAHRHRRRCAPTAVGRDGRTAAFLALGEIHPRHQRAPDPRSRAVAALRRGLRRLRPGADRAVQSSRRIKTVIDYR